MKAAVEPIRQNLGLLTDVDLLDEVRLSNAPSYTGADRPSFAVRQDFGHRDGVPHLPRGQLCRLR